MPIKVNNLTGKAADELSAVLDASFAREEARLKALGLSTFEGVLVDENGARSMVTGDED